MLRTTVHVDLDAQTIRVGGAHSARLTFTSVEAHMPPGELSRPRGYITGARGQLYRRALAAQRVVEYAVDVPVDLARARQMGASFPAELSAAGSALNLAVGLLAASERLAEHNVQAWIELGQNSLLALDSAVAMHAGVRLVQEQPALAALSKLGSLAGRAGGIIDGVRNAASGYQVLFGDDRPIAEELRHNGQLRAALVSIKGSLQFTTGVAGGGLAATQLLVLGGAEATGLLLAAAGPVGLALAVGGLLIASVDIALAVTEKYSEQVTAIRNAWFEAEKVELAGGQASLTARRIAHAHQAVTMRAPA